MGLVHALETPRFALEFLLMTLYGGGGGPLASRGWLFVGFAFARFGEDSGLLAGALETPEGDVKGFVFSDLDRRHGVGGLHGSK